MKASLLIPSIVAVGGSGGGNVNSKKVIIKSDSIPEASEKTLGDMYIFSGETNHSFVHGYIYECKGNEEATSITTDFYPTKLAFDYEAATHPYKTFTSDVDAMEDFFKTILKIDNPHDIVSGKLIVDESTIVDPHEHYEMWEVFCTDKNGNEVLSNYKISAGDMQAYGFQFAYPAADYHSDEPITYTLNWNTIIANLRWERIDVQPSTPILNWYTGNEGTTLEVEQDLSSAELVEIFKNGTLLQNEVDYTISSNTITFTDSLISSDNIAVKIYGYIPYIPLTVTDDGNGNLVVDNLQLLQDKNGNLTLEGVDTKFEDNNLTLI